MYRCVCVCVYRFVYLSTGLCAFVCTRCVCTGECVVCMGVFVCVYIYGVFVYTHKGLRLKQLFSWEDEDSRHQ